jgi:hypothetical protein
MQPTILSQVMIIHKTKLVLFLTIQTQTRAFRSVLATVNNLVAPCSCGEDLGLVEVKCAHTCARFLHACQVTNQESGFLLCVVLCKAYRFLLSISLLVRSLIGLEW